jgi:Arc/MetJ-type ribon-helix-helix transcriptional regulator
VVRQIGRVPHLLRKSGGLGFGHRWPADQGMTTESTGYSARPLRTATFLLGSYQWLYKSMKVSVSLPAEDVEFLDAYANSKGFVSRSAVVHKAVRLLRASGLGGAYEDAWQEWATESDGDVWDDTINDGLA